MSRISVIIVSYNEKKWIKRAIKTCISQTFDDKEIIIVDDGSSDGSREMIEYESQRLTKQGYSIVYYFMQRKVDEKKIIPSIRVSNAIKRGLEFASGEYITLLSADDYFCDDHKFADAIRFLDQHKEYSSYVSGYKKVGQKELRYSYSYIPKDLYWSGRYLHISCFVFRKVFQGNLLDRFCDDVGFAYVLANLGKWKFDPKITFVYDQRDTSIMHKADKIELNILELMLFQDIINWTDLNKCKVIDGTFARFYPAIKYCKRHRNDHLEEKYEKYRIDCNLYKNDILNDTILYDTLDKEKRKALKNMINKMRMKWIIYCLKRKILLRKIEKGDKI